MFGNVWRHNCRDLGSGGAGEVVVAIGVSWTEVRGVARHPTTNRTALPTATTTIIAHKMSTVLHLRSPTLDRCLFEIIFWVSGFRTFRITQNSVALIIWLSSLLREKSTTLVIYILRWDNVFMYSQHPFSVLCHKVHVFKCCVTWISQLVNFGLAFSWLIM